MKPFKRLLIVFVISINLLFPQQLSWACGPWPALPEDFRLSIFDPAVYDTNKEFSPYYFSLNNYYKEDDLNYLASYIENDQNYDEWQAELKKAPFSRHDFYEAVEKYNYQIIADSANELRKSNSFIKALLQHRNEAYFNYFKLAKSTEGFNGDGSSNTWGLDSYSDVSDSLLHHLTYELKHTKNGFVRQRTAYLLCRLFFYNNDAKNIQAVYNTYLNRNDVHSWVKAAAKYYSITALYNSDDSFSKEYCEALIDVIDKSKDKRLPCIRQLLQQPEQKVLSLLSNSHEKATAMAAYTVRKPGYGLADIKRIHTLDPTNKFLPLLLNREINKLEDWLLTPALTEYGTPAARNGYWDWTTDSAVKKVKENLIKDNQYAIDVISFARSINQYHRYDASLCHLFFLEKDWTDAELYCNHILQHIGKQSSLHLQASITHTIIALQKEKRVSPSLQKEIYSLLVDLDVKEKIEKQQTVRNSDYYESGYNNGFTLKDNLLVYLGRTALHMGDIVNASLLLSGTSKPWGEYTTGGDKNAYFLLYEHGRENDFTTLLSIMRKKHKTAYENYFMNRKVDAEGNYTFYDAVISDYRDNITRFWNADKLLNIQGTYFIKVDNLNKAYQAFRQIPDTFWTSKVYQYKDYLTGNPFTLSLYNTHEYFSHDSNRVSNPNKAQFVQKLMQLKNKAQICTNKEEKARLYYAIGNAYYSMSFFGKFWMMSKLWWEQDELNSAVARPISSFDTDYYTAARAKPYYRQAMRLTSNSERAAFYCMYLTECENKRKNFILSSIFKRRHPDQWYYKFDYKNDPYVYSQLLKQHNGSSAFYKQIINECPLYTDFRNKMEKGL